MNLIQQADLLKQVPDQAIATELQRPTGQFPPYLVVAESQRRQKMRQDYEARAGMEKPKTTVAQELASKMMPPPQAVPPQMQGGPMQPGMTQGPPMPGFAEGGIVPHGWMNAGIPVGGFLPGNGMSLPEQAAMINGRAELQGGIGTILQEIMRLAQDPDATAPKPELARPERAQRAAAMSPEEILAARAKFQPVDRYGDILARVAAMEAEAGKRGKMSPWEMMITGGLNMAAAPTASPGRAVSTGGLAAMAERQDRTNQKAEQLRQLLGMRAGIEDQRTRNDRAGLESAMEYGRRNDAANLEQTTAQNALDRDYTNSKNRLDLAAWEHEVGARDRKMDRLSRALTAMGVAADRAYDEKPTRPQINQIGNELVQVVTDPVTGTTSVQRLYRGEERPDRMTFGDRAAMRSQQISDYAASAVMLYGDGAKSEKERVDRIRRGIMRDQTIPDGMRGLIVRDAIRQLKEERLATMQPSQMGSLLGLLGGGGGMAASAPPQSAPPAEDVPTEMDSIPEKKAEPKAEPRKPENVKFQRGKTYSKPTDILDQVREFVPAGPATWIPRIK